MVSLVSLFGHFSKQHSKVGSGYGFSYLHRANPRSTGDILSHLHRISSHHFSRSSLSFMLYLLVSDGVPRSRKTPSPHIPGCSRHFSFSFSDNEHRSHDQYNSSFILPSWYQLSVFSVLFLHTQPCNPYLRSLLVPGKQGKTGSVHQCSWLPG